MTDHLRVGMADALYEAEFYATSVYPGYTPRLIDYKRHDNNIPLENL